MSSLDEFAHLRIPLENILSATNNFSENNVWGEFAFGNHFKGQLLWCGELIDIQAQRFTKEWDEKEQFWMEISVLSSLEHKNLVSLVGFCDENDEKIIILRRETKGSLENYLSDSKRLTWVRRLEISVGLAHALSYIHYDEQRNFSVIHRNIDTERVELNDKWEPKLSEFRHSMKVRASQRHNSFDTKNVFNTMGYTDPTYLETKRAHHKSDVYSFGIVMFELLCGRKAVIDDEQDNKYLASLAVNYYREKKLNEIIDWDLWNQMDSQSFNIFVEIAYECLNEERLKRPNIDEIVTRLEKALELQQAHHNVVISSRMDNLAHLKIPLKSILSATNNFDDTNVYLLGGYDKRYMAQLSWSGELIEIIARRFNKDRDEMFWTEVSMLSCLKHQNLASLLGFCYENGEKIIIIRHEMNGSLDNYLSDATLLTWVQRLKISVGLAHALSYIHYDEPRDFSIIHRDISSFAVLLNDKFEPKLSFFEMSMKIEASQRHHSFHTSEVWGSDGYTDPTSEATQIVNHKTDMYSFGIVLLELLCGRESIITDDTNTYLAPAAILLYKEKKLNELVDWDLWKQMGSQSFGIFAEIAYDCLNDELLQRPSIDEIVTRLEKVLELQLEHQNAIMSSLEDELAHLKIPLENILSVTNNFAHENIIYSDEICNEYKGQLVWNGDLIDIHARRLNKERDDEDEDEEQFWMDVSMLSSLKHKNLVSIVGFCDENREKILITRHETRGSLDDYLSDPMLLTWVRRLEICVGISHALSYLHYDEHRDFSVIHRYITCNIVLLNEDWEPMLRDFQCSMKIKASKRYHTFHTNKLKYVNGYGDPTYIETKRVSHKSDMYSFGIVLFELLCGRESIIGDKDDNHLAPLAITHYREKRLDKIIDNDLWKQMDLQSFTMFAEIAYDCLNEEQSQRPNIDDIVPRLAKALELARENRPIHFAPNHLAHLRIPLEDIEFATNYFAKKNVISRGGIGKRYKGQLSWCGELIDIDAERLMNKEWNEIERQFWTEISMLSSLKHKNVVSILGFCNEVGAETIIYKHESRRYLRFLLSDPVLLTWVKRLEICVNIAHALKYIHYYEPREFSVIHRNISSYTIILKDDWEPKLLGFHNSIKVKASERHNTFYTGLFESTKGTYPTYAGNVNLKLDIYSFGIVLLELMCGRESVSDGQDNKYLAPVAIYHYREKILDGIIDPDLWKQMNPRSLNIFAETAYECLNEEESQRPDITTTQRLT